MRWSVEIGDEFEPEFDALPEQVQTEILAADGEWRVAFAFDPKRRAILLVARDKSGGSEKRFYRELIRKADERFDAHLARLKKEKE